MSRKEYSRSIDIGNAKKLYNGLSESNKVLIEAMMNMVFALFQNIQLVQGGTSQSERKEKD